MENTSRYAVGDLVLVGPGRAPGRIIAPRPLPGGGQTYDVVLDRLVVDGWSEEEATVRGVCEHWLAPAAQHEGREAGLPGRTDRASEKMVTCPRCGTRHPYASIGNLCTACVEARARAEKYGDALAAGYRMDRRGAWHRIEQAREEREVFGEDRRRY